MSVSDQTLQERFWPVGIVIVFFGSLSGALGDNMVRKAYTDEATKKNKILKKESVRNEDNRKKKNEEKIVMIHNKTWVIGMILTTLVDSGCTITALVFAPASVVTPFAGVHIFWSIMLAKFWLRESVGKWDYLGCIFIVLGVILIIAFAGKSSHIYTLDDINPYVHTPTAILYITICGVLVILCIFFSTDVSLKLSKVDKTVQRLAVSTTSGLLGGNTNLAAKAFTVVLTQFFKGQWNIFLDWKSYIVTLATITLAVGQLIYLNKGLRKYEAIYIVPTTNSILIACGSIGAIMLLNEIPNDWVAFFIGLLLAISGILLLTFKRKFINIQHILPNPVEDLEKPLPSSSLEMFMHCCDTISDEKMEADNSNCLIKYELDKLENETKDTDKNWFKNKLCTTKSLNFTAKLSDKITISTPDLPTHEIDFSFPTMYIENNQDAYSAKHSNLAEEETNNKVKEIYFPIASSFTFTASVSDISITIKNCSHNDCYVYSKLFLSNGAFKEEKIVVATKNSIDNLRIQENIKKEKENNTEKSYCAREEELQKVKDKE